MNELSRDEDLLATCWTTAGDAAPLRGDEQSPIPLQERSDMVRSKLLSAAEALGARHIKVGPDVADQAWDYDRWVTEFAGLAEDAHRAGVRVGLEFLPWSNIKTVHDGLRIVGVELSDADTDQLGTLFEDTANRRRLCGQGSFDLRGCIRALRAAGWTGPWGVEILSEHVRRLPVREATAAAFTTAAAQLGLADDGR